MSLWVIKFPFTRIVETSYWAVWCAEDDQYLIGKNYRELRELTLATPHVPLGVFKSARRGIPARLHASINSLAKTDWLLWNPTAAQIVRRLSDTILRNRSYLQLDRWNCVRSRQRQGKICSERISRTLRSTWLAGRLTLFKRVYYSVLAEILVCPCFCTLPAEAGPLVVVWRITVMKAIRTRSVKMRLFV